MADEADTTATETSTTTETAATEVAAETVETGAETEEAAEPSLMSGAKEGETTEGEATEETAEEVVGPPEAYELTAPEGFDIDATLLAEATPVLKELGLSNENANKLMPFAGKIAEGIAKRQQDEFQAMGADWAKQAKEDPEIGGRNWTQTESYVAKALDQFGAPVGSDFRKLLDETQLGNHPEMIRMFRTIGERISEDTNFVRGDSGAPVKLPREAVLYPDDVPK